MSKISQLQNWFEHKGKVLIAVSGGVDSALVAYAAYSKLGDDCIAITADYKTLSQDELESAKQICQEIGINHRIISYNELDNDKFVVNDKNRCFHCRNELGTYLQNFAKENSFETIVDGTNLDDLEDFRPGLDALRQYKIRSPLLETNFTKHDVRTSAKKIGLSIHNRPSNSCLASRIPWGQRVTAEKLTRIELGETFVKQTIGARQVRVRDLDGIAKIEIGKDELSLLSDFNKLEKIQNKLELIGFSSVEFDPEGYRTGKINVMFD